MERHNTINVPADTITTSEKGNVPVWLNFITIACSEFLGTALLVFLTCMGCTTGMFGEQPPPIMQMSLASGLSVMTAIQIFGHISGAHVNPAVTLPAFIMGQIPLITVPIYVIAQIVGAVTGYGLLMAVTPEEYYDIAGHCVPSPNDAISLFQAWFVEFSSTFILVLAICASWDSRNNKGDSIALKIGFLVFLLNISAGAYTGASMNPARSLGPTIFSESTWKTHWVYWAGPVLGGGLAGLLYKKLFLYGRD